MSTYARKSSLSRARARLWRRRTADVQRRVGRFYASVAETFARWVARGAALFAATVTQNREPPAVGAAQHPSAAGSALRTSGCSGSGLRPRDLLVQAVVGLVHAQCPVRGLRRGVLLLDVQATPMTNTAKPTLHVDLPQFAPLPG